jgi:hypothetical protein
MPQVQRKAQLLPDIWSGVLQCSQGPLVLFLVARNRDIHAGVAEIVSHANFGHGDQGQTRVFQFVTHDLRNLFTQSFGYALWAMHDKSLEFNLQVVFDELRQAKA